MGIRLPADGELRLTSEERGTQGSRAAVAMGAATLVLAVWTSLWMAQSRVDVGDVPGSRDLGLPEALEGFRQELFYLPDDSLLGFVPIPAGPFVMGSDPGVDPLALDIEWWGEGRVQGTVDLGRFYMARFETTVAQFAAFVEEAAYPLAEPNALAAPPTHPVTWVAWTDAVAYARWLDGALRDDPDTPPSVQRLLADGWRVALPSEAQWEKAARSDDGRLYPWGNEPSREHANYRASSTRPARSAVCSDCAYGLSDMAGNAWEWTRSPYQPYPFDESDDAETAGTDALWVIRGGSFGDNEQFVRAANRGLADPGARRDFIGFRVALVR